MEIFTISGADYESPASLQDAATDEMCAQKVKSLVIAGGVARVGAVPVALFGTYKMFKAHWAAGVVSLIGASILWAGGGSLVRAAAQGFQQCRGVPSKTWADDVMAKMSKQP
ncbi:MAG: hypothetical protein A2Y38_23555 [Spirochaetes bacterium GWB1_59_5]|nr:MAG: hypothetical protein A2Y38_23555 [Spirochaetes bacterium GWB1_59_5]